MTSASTSGAFSGAAQGAVTGAMIGGPAGAAIGGVAGGILGLFGGKAADRNQKIRREWMEYSKEIQYMTDMFNLDVQSAIAAFNAKSVMLSAKADATLAYKNATYNMGVIAATTQYNNALVQEELEDLWEDEELAQEQLALFAAREKGTIVANQAASGTVIGEGSNRDIVVGQMTQRALDSEIIKFGADRKAAVLANAQAKGTWEGQVAINQAMWEGEMAASRSMMQAATTAAGIGANAAMGRVAGEWNAEHNRLMADAGIAMDQANFNNQQTQNLVNGLFSAAGTGAQLYYFNKNPRSITTPGTSLATENG